MASTVPRPLLIYTARWNYTYSFEWCKLVFFICLKYYKINVGKLFVDTWNVGGKWWWWSFSSHVAVNWFTRTIQRSSSPSSSFWYGEWIFLVFIICMQIFMSILNFTFMSVHNLGVCLPYIFASLLINYIMCSSMSSLT